jgi:hypothetical protein
MEQAQYIENAADYRFAAAARASAVPVPAAADRHRTDQSEFLQGMDKLMQDHAELLRELAKH